MSRGYRSAGHCYAEDGFVMLVIPTPVMDVVIRMDPQVTVDMADELLAKAAEAAGGAPTMPSKAKP
jgi:hypothetical protein